MQSNKRPKYINLLTLAPKMSITAKISILHRVSGVILFLSIPFLLYILDKSLNEQDFYNTFYTIMSSIPAKLIYIILIWAMMHHMCAGIRFLLLDMHTGIERKTAQNTAKIVVGISVTLTIILGAIIW